MNLFASLLLFFGGMILLGILGTIGRFLDRGRGNGLLQVGIPVLVGVALFLGGSLYLDNNGDIVPGTVVNKLEEIRTRSTGTWNRSFNIDVQFQPGNSTLSTTEREVVDQTLYDTLRVGDTVQVRYIQPAGLFLFWRLKQQSTLSLVPWDFVWPIFLAISFGLIVWLWVRNAPTRKPRRARTALTVTFTAPDNPAPENNVAPPPPAPRRKLPQPLLILASLLWIAAVLVTIYRPVILAQSTDSWLTATAQIAEIRRYNEVTYEDRTSRTFPVVQPFDIVQFTFIPDGMKDAVKAVDVVDVMTAQTAEIGSRINIKYSPDDPRIAQIQGAEYTHLWKNPLEVVGLVLGTILVLGLFWLFLRLLWHGFVLMISRR